MPKNDAIPTGPGGPDDDKWNVVLDEDFVRGASIHEPPAPGRSRVWPIVLALGVLTAALAGVTLYMTEPSSEDHVAARPRKTAAASPAPAAPAAPASTSDAARPMVPLADVFPERVPDGAGDAFTRVASKALEACTEQGAVGPRLAAMIAEGKGCVGEQIALYKNAQGDQFNLAVFTMKDPKDTVRLVTELTMAFDDYQVAAQAPPPGSGLATLGPETGMVQSFTGYGRVMVVALGQWSDGRTADFQKLVDRMRPLQDGVTDRVKRYEGTR